jgi:hypothetical protein
VANGAEILGIVLGCHQQTLANNVKPFISLSSVSRLMQAAHFFRVFTRIRG